MNHWTSYLPSDVYQRLCNCNSLKSDLPALIDAKMQGYKDKGKFNFTKEDALVDILELLDSNSQEIDLTKEEYMALI